MSEVIIFKDLMKSIVDCPNRKVSLFCLKDMLDFPDSKGNKYDLGFHLVKGIVSPPKGMNKNLTVIPLMDYCEDSKEIYKKIKRLKPTIKNFSTFVMPKLKGDDKKLIFYSLQFPKKKFHHNFKISRLENCLMVDRRVLYSEEVFLQNQIKRLTKEIDLYYSK